MRTAGLREGARAVAPNVLVGSNTQRGARPERVAALGAGLLAQIEKPVYRICATRLTKAPGAEIADELGVVTRRQKAPDRM